MNPEQAKAAADMMLAIWEGEVRGTAQVLAAIGRGNRDYKPDPKSRTAWEIATHIATADMFFLDGVINGKLEYDAEGDKRAQAQFTSAADLESFYTKSFPERATAIRALPGEALAQPMSFFGMWEWPRARFIGWANNHSIHHRGQLAAYLRAMGSRVPDIYGPSADSEKKAAATS